MKTPVTKARLINHFTYSAWKYLLVCACAIFGWSLIYTQTAYRSPQDKRIDLYIKSGTLSEELMESYFETLRKETAPEMEIIQGVSLLASSSDDYYSQMQLTTYIMAGEGDIYILPAEDFKSFAAQGVFIPLEELVQDGTLHLDGIDTAAGYVTIRDEDTGTVETHMYGVPLESLYGFMDSLQLDNRGKVLAITVNNQNDENVIPFADVLIQRNRADKPDWLLEQEAAN